MFWLIFPAVLLIALEWWRPSLLLKVKVVFPELWSNRGRARPEHTLPKPFSRAVSNISDVRHLPVKPSTAMPGEQIAGSYDTPDKPVIFINKARHVNISGQSTPSQIGDGFTIDWMHDLKHGAISLQQASAKEGHDNTTKLVSDLQTIIETLENRWGPSAGVEERCTWSEERECFNKIINDLMQQRSQMEHNLQAMEQCLRQEKAALEREKRQHEEQMKQFVFRVDAVHKQFIGEALSQMSERSLRDVVLRLAKDFDVYTLGVDCGLNFLMEVKAEKWGEVQSRLEEIQQELSQLFQHKFLNPMKWHAEEVDKKDRVCGFHNPPKTTAKKRPPRTRSLGSATTSPRTVFHSKDEELDYLRTKNEELEQSFEELYTFRETISGIVKRLNTQESRHSGSDNECDCCE